jgi:Uma2 family endonuclease
VTVLTARTEWTVDDYYALPDDDGMRHELVDGTLLVSPTPRSVHQVATARLRTALAAAAGPDLEVVEAFGVAVPSGILVPDVVVATATALYANTRDLSAADAHAVIEVVSPSSRRRDRQWKPELYAEAGIPAYVRVELEEPQIVGYALEGDTYVEVRTLTGDDEGTLHLPFAVTLRPTQLVGPPAR